MGSKRRDRSKTHSPTAPRTVSVTSRHLPRQAQISPTKPKFRLPKSGAFPSITATVCNGCSKFSLALCEENSEHIYAAMNAYRSARMINKDAGIVEDALHLFDCLDK
jgi:hypothetical protein